MADHPQSHRDISALFNDRRKTRDAEIAAMNAVDGAIKGHIPDAYNALFADNDVRIALQTTRSAYDTLRKYLGEVPVLPHVDPLGKRESNPTRDKAELVEKIMHGYHNGSALRGGPSFELTTNLLADYQVAFYDGVMLIHADHERKLIYFEAKDPRCHYPPVGWHPWSMNPLDGTLLVYEMTLGQVKQTFGYDTYGNARSDVITRLNNAYKPAWGAGGNFTVNDSQIIQVGAYRSREAWFIVALSDTDIVLSESETGDKKHPGVTGVVSFKQHGAPLLTGQIGIEAALMKVMNQQIQNTDRINNASTIGPPLVGDKMVVGGYNVVDLSLLQGRNVPIQRLAPDSPNNLTQVMGSLIALAEKFNYNPESASGGGPAVSGKAIQQLQAGPRSLVTGILFSPHKTAFPRAYDDGMEMELNLWPNEKKTIRGRNGKQTFEVDYTPSAALQGYRGHVRIEDARPGGYNAKLEAIQSHDAGLAPLIDVLEADPDVKNVQLTLRRLEAEQTGKFLQAAFEGMAAQDPIQAARLSIELLKRIRSGVSRDEAIASMAEEGMLEPPPPPPEEMMPGGGGGLPPELAAMMGGGDMPALPPPADVARAM